MSNLLETLRYYEKKEAARKRQTLEEFKFPTKKKFSHDVVSGDLPDSTGDRHNYAIMEILEPREKQTDIPPERELGYSSKESSKENVQKNLTWRSPLIFSPPVKFSPRMDFSNIRFPPGYKDTHNETWETSTSSKSNANLTVHVQGTPVQSQSREISTRRAKENRHSHFPLRDRDYGETSINEPYDICSDSFLEMFGLPNNQRKSAPKFKKPHPSPTLNYYSQLLSQPIQVQKHKTPQKNAKKDNEPVTPQPFENSFRRDFNSSQRFCPDPDRDNIQNPPQDVTSSNKNARQGSISPYSHVKCVPQIDMNASYASCFPETYPTPDTRQNYERTHVPHYPDQARFPNSLHDFTRDNCAPTKSYPTPYDYRAVPSTPKYQYGNTCGGNMKNVPPYLNPSRSEPIAVNVPDYEDFHRQQLYSGYFPKDRTNVDDCLYQRSPKADNYGGCRIFNEPRETYPEMMSFQDLNRRDVTQSRPLRFERKTNDERSILAPISNRDASRSYWEENNPRCLPNRSPWTYRGEPSKPRDAFPRSGFDGGPRDNPVQNLNRSYFGDNSNVATLTRIPTMCSQRNDLNRSFCPRTICHEWESQDCDLRCESNLHFNSFGVPRQERYPEQFVHFPSIPEDTETFPSSNDKEYVMNRFLSSLNQK